MLQLLQTQIAYLKGVGPQRADTLSKELDIVNYGQLLHFFPFRYIDRSKFYSIREINSDAIAIQLKGTITQLQEVGVGRKKRLTAKLTDDSGTLDLVWFKGVTWVKSGIVSGKEYIVFGKPTAFKGRYNMAHPELEAVGETSAYGKGALQPVYHSTEKLGRKGLNSKGIEKIIRQLLTELGNQLPEILYDELLKKQNLMSRADAFSQIHFPSNHNQLKRAQFRLKYEELVFLQMMLVKQKLLLHQHVKGFKFDKLGEKFHSFYEEHMPFELTNAQKRVVREVRKDMNTGAQMNRLVQGDVGSGKTLVAFLSMLVAIDNGFQACLMAPTEILATQHAQSLSEYADAIGIRLRLLTGSTKQKERKDIHYELESGTLDILVGTHALLEDKVKFKNLGLGIIDEQHRFGVAQRAKFWKKNTLPPHILVMTATPIPRTLAMTLYGDLDVSVIDELPPGRKPVKTIHRYDSSRLAVFGFMEEKIKLGRQVYVVYPLIEESEKMDYKDLMDGYESISRAFPMPKYNISIVHGKMKPEAKEYEMNQFASGKTQILVATTVIEVGVNVPNASVMVIESANKFGLSQLHQLRGRVGRGSDKSYCILMTDYKLTETAKKRIQTMVGTNDGFVIAEEDLKLRGPGDIMGTKQSGLLDLKIGDLTKDNHLVATARNSASQLLKIDAELELQENYATRLHLAELIKNKPNWGRIS